MKFCIVGLGVFGRNLALHLARLGTEVLALDRKEENVSAIKDHVAAAAVIDFTDPAPLGEFPIREMDAVIIAIGDDFESSLLFTARAQELGALKVVCRVLSPMHEKLLRLMKVDRVIVPEELAARGLAQSLLLRGVLDGYDLGDEHAIIEVRVPSDLVNKKPHASPELFTDHDVQLVAVKRVRRSILTELTATDRGQPPQRRVLAPSDPELALLGDDVLVLFGADKNLRRFIEAHTER